MSSSLHLLHISDCPSGTPVETWAAHVWQSASQPATVVVLPSEGQAACIYMVSAQSQGWLYSPLYGQAQAPLWQHGVIPHLESAFAQARARGFCLADAVVLGMMGALAALDNSTTPFSCERRYFPLLGSPRASAFAAMPRSFFQSAHSHGLYAVMGDADWVVRCMEMGVKLVQLRLKNASPDALDAQIHRCAQAAVRHNALLIINDHWQAALRHVLHRNTHGIYGIHMGQEDLALLADSDLDRIQLAGLRLGLSTHSLWELSRALRTRPSHVACGPVHATTTKDMPWKPLGDVNVAWWAQLVHGQAGSDHLPLPLVAIGGMQPERAYNAAAAGADCVAVVSDITQAADPVQQVQALQQAITKGQGRRATHPAPAWPQPTL